MAMNKDGTRTGYVLLGASFAAPHATGTVALCIASGACSGLTVPQIVAKFVADAQSYRIDHTSYGYTGDPFNPVSGKYFGYLVAPDPF
jgi:hypothetical protein